MSAVKHQRKIPGQKKQVWGILYLPDGRRTITCTDDGSLQVWDLESGKQEGKNWQDKDSRSTRAIALSPGGKEVASGSDDGIVRLWDIETGKVTARWTGHSSGVPSVCWSPDGSQLVSGSDDGTARMWNVESGETILELIKTGHTYVRVVHYSPDATMIATGGYDGGNASVKLWDVKTGELLKTLKADKLGEVLCLAWCSDVDTLISGSLNFSHGSLRKFDTAIGAQTAVLEGHRNLVKALSLSPNHRILASASSDNTTRLWNIETNQPIGPPLLHKAMVRSTAFSPDGKLLATVCDDHHIYTWNVTAIVWEAGLGNLLTASAPKVGGKLISETDATQRRKQKPTDARRLPPGFFNDAHVGSSATRLPAPRHGRGSHTTPSSSRTLLGRVSSLFPRFHHTTPRVVEVPTVQDRKALYVSPPRQKKQLLQVTHTQGQQQQQGQSHGQASSSRPPVTTATATSATSAAAGATPASTTATPSGPAAANKLSLWTRIVLCICCVSVDYTNGHNG
jgi:WD40 repeat protein